MCEDVVLDRLRLMGNLPKLQRALGGHYSGAKGVILGIPALAQAAYTNQDTPHKCGNLARSTLGLGGQALNALLYVVEIAWKIHTLGRGIEIGRRRC